MLTTPRTLLAALLVASALFIAGCSKEPEKSTGPDLPPDETGSETVLRFSAIPDQNTTMLQEKFGPIADYLSKELGVPVEYVPATNYSASVEMFSNGDIQLAWFGGLTGVQARDNVAGAHAIAQGKEDPQYYSYVIANENSGLEKSDAFPAGIADVSFTFGSESSTSGRLMPEYFIRENSGQSPEEFFKKGFAFSGAHDKTCKQVEDGTHMAGVCSYKAYDKLVKNGKIDPSKCKIIWQTPFYADYNFTAHPVLEKSFGAGFTKKLQTALVGMKDPKLLDAFPRSAIIPAKDEEFDGIKKVAIELGMLRG